MLELEYDVGNTFFDVAQAMGVQIPTIVGAIASMFAAMCVRSNPRISAWEEQGNGLITNDMRIELLVADIKVKIAQLEEADAERTNSRGDGEGGEGETGDGGEGGSAPPRTH